MPVSSIRIGTGRGRFVRHRSPPTESETVITNSFFTGKVVAHVKKQVTYREDVVW